MDEVFRRSFYNPEPFRVYPASMPPEAQAVAAGNRAALAVPMPERYPPRNSNS
jgi:hypothetical protein